MTLRSGPMVGRGWVVGTFVWRAGRRQPTDACGERQQHWYFGL